MRSNETLGKTVSVRTLGRVPAADAGVSDAAETLVGSGVSDSTVATPVGEGVSDSPVATPSVVGYGDGVSSVSDEQAVTATVATIKETIANHFMVIMFDLLIHALQVSPVYHEPRHA